MPWTVCPEAVPARGQPQRLPELCRKLQTELQPVKLSPSYQVKAGNIFCNNITVPRSEINNTVNEVRTKNTIPRFAYMQFIGLS